MILRLQSHYFPAIAWLKEFHQKGEAFIFPDERFEKQTYRNRCRILGPNGVQDLIVPVIGRNKKQLVREVQISYTENWIRVHLHAIRTAYSSAPYFDYFYPEIAQILESKPLYLHELNRAIIHLFFKRLGWSMDKLKYVSALPEEFFFPEIHPKKPDHRKYPEYPQVFSEKGPFAAGLSGLDLLMNRLQKANDYLTFVQTSV